MTIKEKILAFLDFKGIKKTSFFEEAGISPSNFKGNARLSELGGDKIAKILTVYPELSAEWLMRGEGEMIRSDKGQSTSHIHAPVELSTNKIEDKNLSNNSIPPDIVNRLFNSLGEKDTTIREQAEEIGHLRERINQLQSEIKKLASAAHGSAIANAG